MIATSPVFMVNTYRANHDLYRISAARKASSVNPVAKRQQPPTPYEQSFYKQFAHKEASGISSSLEQLPPQELFNLKASSMKPYNQYQSRLQAYQPPVPMNGLLLDRFV